MYKTHPHFWCSILGQKGASYTRVDTVHALCVGRQDVERLVGAAPRRCAGASDGPELHPVALVETDDDRQARHPAALLLRRRVSQRVRAVRAARALLRVPRAR